MCAKTLSSDAQPSVSIPMDARFTLQHGAITLTVNGVPQPCVTYKSTESPNDQLFADTVRKSAADMAERGVHVHLVPVFFDWPEPGVYDFSRMDWRVAQVLQADPAAWVIIRIQAASMAPAWWMKANPDAIVAFGFEHAGDAPRPANQTLPAPSLASDFWETAGLPALQALAEHVQAQPYAARVIGYLPTSYNTNEWFFRSYDGLQVNDLCPAMQTRFAGWLKDTYGVTGGITGGVTGDVRVPGRMARHLADRGYFFEPDPRRSVAPVVAYYQFANRLNAETIIKVCRTLRQAHEPDHIIVGTFYGYMLELAQFYWLADSGHLSMARMMEADGPDFTCSPLAYFTRNPHELPGGGFMWSLSAAVDSARLHGKAYFGEDDFRVPGGTGLTTWAGAQTRAEDVETLRRNFAFTLCNGQNQWWYDLGGHYFDPPHRLDVVEACTAIAYEALDRDRASVSEIAVVMDESAPMMTQLDKGFQRAAFWESFFHSFARIGAPVDLLMLSDLAAADMDQYKAIFFPTCYAPGAEDRARIEALKQGGRTLVFYLADGFIDPEGAGSFDLRAVRDLTGIEVKTADRVWHNFLRLTTGRDHPLLAGFEDRPFGMRSEKIFTFYVDDPGAEALATFNGLGAVGLARKAFESWTSIYSAVPVLDPVLVHNIITAAGVHIYTSDREDIVYACASYLALFTRQGGTRTVWLPAPRRVRERFHDVIDADAPVQEIRWDAKPYTTYLFEMR
ncbi:MAG: hypothetical protein P1S60_01940 [Anaerolineae bacterium]|nr:hypothetical protein [Anaerolineae bacterium]